MADRAPHNQYPYVVNVRLSERQRRALQLLAAEDGVTNSTVLREVLNDHIESLPKKWRDQLDLDQDEFVETLASFLSDSAGT